MTTPSFQFLGQKTWLPPCCLTFSYSLHLTYQSFTLKIYAGDFPCGPVADTPSEGGLGLIPLQGTRSHMLQLQDPACCNQDLPQPKQIDKH